jgi:hypothetical protein
LKVPDEVIGKSVRCPVCKSVLLATPSAAPATIASASAPDTDTDAAMVRFTCGACGKEMQALAEYGGQETGCPDCNASVIIPIRSGLATPARQVTPAVRAPVPDLSAPSAAGVPSARRLRARRKRRLWLWVGGGSVLLVLGLGLVPWLFGYGLFFYFFRGPAAPDLALIPLDAQGFVTVRAADVWDADALRRLRNEQPEIRDAIKKRETELGLAVTDCERVTLVLKDVEAAFRLGGDEREVVWWVVCLTSRPYDKKKLLDALAPGAVELSYQNRRYHASERSTGAIYFHSDRVFAAGPKWGVHACLDHLASPKSDGPLKAAVKEAAAGKHQLVIGIAPKLRDLESVRKGLPAAVQPLASLLDARYLMGTADLKSSLELELTLAFADAAKAGEAKTAVDDLRKLAAEKLDQARKAAKDKDQQKEKEFFDQLESTLGGLKVEQKKELVVVQAKSDASLAMLAALTRANDVTLAVRSGENLQRLMRAMKEYREANVNKRYPAANPNNRLSWRVHLLPYLGVGEKELYGKFNLNEDYNSPHNRQLKDQMPAVFRMPDQPPGVPTSLTYYQVFVGPKAPFDGNRQLAVNDIKGLSNTIAIAEAAVPVEWTKPDGDIKFDPLTFPETSPGWPGGGSRFSVVMFDGTVYTYPRNMDLIKLKALITYNGREPVTP